MSRTILVDPVTRIEGHAKISIMLDDADQVSEARFHIGDFRGFEKRHSPPTRFAEKNHDEIAALTRAADRLTRPSLKT